MTLNLFGFTLSGYFVFGLVFFFLLWIKPKQIKFMFSLQAVNIKKSGVSTILPLRAMRTLPSIAQTDHQIFTLQLTLVEVKWKFIFLSLHCYSMLLSWICLTTYRSCWNFAALGDSGNRFMMEHNCACRVVLTWAGNLSGLAICKAHIFGLQLIQIEITLGQADRGLLMSWPQRTEGPKTS